MAEYDLIVSLGGNCAAAGQLKHRGLRPFAMPFDWMLMRDTRPLEFLPTAIANRFADFALRENLVEFEPATKEHGREVRHCLDNASGFRLIHHLHGDVKGPAYDEFRATFNRRLERLYTCIGKSRKVLFVLSTGFTYDEALLRPIRSALQSKFPGVEIVIKAVEFGAERPGEFSEAGISGMRIARPVDPVYDVQHTGAEWKWLDSITLTGAEAFEAKRKRFPWNWLYKSWMSLGRKLELQGLGCCNLRFMRCADTEVDK